MKKPAFAGRASSVTSKHILAPSCLVVDAAVAHLHLDLLHKKDTETRLRAIPFRGEVIKGNFTNLDKFAELNSSGMRVYLVVNSGGDKDIEITQCHAFFAEWDNIPKEKQLYIYKEKNLPVPTFMLDTGGKSIHYYWVFKSPIATEIWLPIQRRLLDYCKADTSIKNPSRVMRLAGFYYIDKEGNPTVKSQIINVTGKEYSVEDIAQVLPEPKVEAPRYKKVITKTDWTLREVGEALDTIPRRVTGNNTYEEYRQIAWGLKAILKDMGRSESLAIELMEAHSPSGKVSGWDIPQVMRSGGERTGAGTFIYYAQKHGWRPKAK